MQGYHLPMWYLQQCLKSQINAYDSFKFHLFFFFKYYFAKEILLVYLYLYMEISWERAMESVGN